jgi:hypothetical protein
VSTYKGEFDAAKPVLDALAPFKPYLEQHGIEPAQWVNNLGTAHWKLVYGNPQERLSMFAQLARDYRVPLEQMFVRDQQGQIFFNQQLLQAVQQPQQQQPQDVAALVRNEMQDHFTKQEVAKFSAENPHFDQVRETMVGLLQSGLASDLPERITTQQFDFLSTPKSGTPCKNSGPNRTRRRRPRHSETPRKQRAKTA